MLTWLLCNTLGWGVRRCDMWGWLLGNDAASNPGFPLWILSRSFGEKSEEKPGVIFARDTVAVMSQILEKYYKCSLLLRLLACEFEKIQGRETNWHPGGYTQPPGDITVPLYCVWNRPRPSFWVFSKAVRQKSRTESLGSRLAMMGHSSVVRVMATQPKDPWCNFRWSNMHFFTDEANTPKKNFMSGLIV